MNKLEVDLETLTPLEGRILGIIRQHPSVTQKELAYEAQVARNTAMVAVSSLIHKGLIRERGYYLSYASIPLGFILMKSPEVREKIKEPESKLEKYGDLGRWGMISDTTYDYVFFLYVQNGHPKLLELFSDIRETIGANSETHFVIAKNTVIPTN